MHLSIKQLTLSDLILKRSGSPVFRVVLAVFGVALRLFFRRIETVNADVVPKGPGVIFVMNHPNGLIDPAMVFVALPRKISFLAKSTLFRMPVISFLLRTVEALPLYRKIDAGEDVSKNQKTFELCRELLQKGGSIALFPEGVSHNSPKMLPAKTGAARIALGAVSVAEGKDLDLRIVPVGLFYTSKTTFRSEALLHFGEPFKVEPVAMNDEGQPDRNAVKELTAKIENALRDVTLNAETDNDLHTARMAEEILASAETNETLGEKLEFLKKFVAETSDDADIGDNRSELREKLVEYDRKLDEHGLEPEHLSLAQFSQRSVIRQAFILSAPLVAMLPLAVVGTVLHYPAYRLCGFVAKRMARHGADDIASTVKVLAGMVFIPLTWLITAGVVTYFLGWKSGLLSIPLVVVCGYVALRVSEEITELSGWARAIWMFLTRRETFLRMFVERRELQHELREFDQ